VEELKTLVECARSGDLDAFGALVRRYQDMATGYAHSVLGDYHQAEDVAQRGSSRRLPGAFNEHPIRRIPVSDAVPVGQVGTFWD